MRRQHRTGGKTTAEVYGSVGGITPGKRSLVQARYASMDAPKSESLHEERATIDADSPGQPRRRGGRGNDDIDAPKEDSILEERATIDPGLTNTDEGIGPGKLSRAKKRNPRWAKKLGLSPSDFDCSSGPETDEFAKAVASYAPDRNG